MSSIRIFSFACVLSTLVAGGSVQAQDDYGRSDAHVQEAEDDFGRSGAYVGANATYAWDLLQTEIYSVAGFGTVPLDYSDSWGFNVRAGYRIASFIAVEAQYEWLDGIDISAPGFGPIGTYHPDVLTGNLKLILPTWRLQPYALAGVGMTSWSIDFAPNTGFAEASDTGFAFRGGAGIDIYLSEHLVLNTEGTAVLNTADFTLPSTGGPATVQSDLYFFSLSAGLAYRF
jgi:opacity protein-like surface antigen